MNKILKLLFILVFILLSLDKTIALDFKTNTNITENNQVVLKKQTEVIYNKINNIVEKLTVEKQIVLINKLNKKIDKIISKKITDKNKYIFEYLKFLLNEKLTLLETSNKVSQELVIEALCTIENWVWKQTVTLQDWKIVNTSVCKVKSCDKWYIISEWKKCILEEQDVITIVTRTCKISNWTWNETLTFNNWNLTNTSACTIINCDTWYNLKDWVCWNLETNSKLSTYPWCDTPDIIVGNYTIAACNVGVTKAWVWADSLWTRILKWSDIYTDNNWICAKGYHIPNRWEWSWIITAWSFWDNWLKMSEVLLLPMWFYYDSKSFYWSSTTNLVLWFTNDKINASTEYWFTFWNNSEALPVRCFKN